MVKSSTDYEVKVKRYQSYTGLAYSVAMNLIYVSCQSNL